MRNIASIAILAACIAVAATAQTSVIQPSGSSPAKEIRTFEIQSGGDLKITNVNGGIKVTAHDKNEVALTATFTPSRKNDEYPRIEVDSKKNYLELIVKYPNGKNLDGMCCEMELFVPRQINSKINTVNGSIELNEIEGSHNVNTVNGSVALDSVNGNIGASSVNGSVMGTLQKNKGDLKASTVNGSIKFTLSDPNCTLNASTVNGKVTLNTLGAREVTTKKHSVSATFGNGDAKIKLTTVNGSIVVQ